MPDVEAGVRGRRKVWEGVPGGSCRRQVRRDEVARRPRADTETSSDKWLTLGAQGLMPGMSGSWVVGKTSTATASKQGRASARGHTTSRRSPGVRASSEIRALHWT